MSNQTTENNKRILKTPMNIQKNLPASITKLAKTNSIKINDIATSFVFVEFIIKDTRHSAVIVLHDNAVHQIRTHCLQLSTLMCDCYAAHTQAVKHEHYQIIDVNQNVEKLLLIINDGLQHDIVMLQPEPAVFLIDFDEHKWLENEFRVAYSVNDVEHTQSSSLRRRVSVRQRPTTSSVTGYSHVRDTGASQFLSFTAISVVMFQSTRASFHCFFRRLTATCRQTMVSHHLQL